MSRAAGISDETQAGRGHARNSITWAKRTSATVLIAAASSAAVATAANAAPAARTPGSAAAAHGNASYRHGLIPMVGSAGAHAMAAAASDPSGVTENLSYGGGDHGVGVTTGPEKVYLVFWGSEWGTAGTDAQGYTTYTGDPKGVAPRLQAFFKGLGTGNDTWSGVMTQYCQGVPVGAMTCPASAQHVAYPTGGALAGVWEDSSSKVPASASAHQIGAEAVKAATHFGNKTAVSNRDTQYMIVSPTGADPDGYKGNGFCAWHDYTGDSGMDGGGAVPSPDGLLAFTNLPYLPDIGKPCGADFVNPGSAGLLDGMTIVAGHEYAETLTDQYPSGGWTDLNGAETGDKCIWRSKGQGASADITLTTGTFAVQSTWSNDFNGGMGQCEIAHPVFQHGDTVTIFNPGAEESDLGKAVTLHLIASDSAKSQPLTYTASRLPKGLSINAATGSISGIPTVEGKVVVSVMAKDPTGALATAFFSWVIIPAGSCTAQQLLGNPGFETGKLTPWSGSSIILSKSGSGYNAHSGKWFIWMDGMGIPTTDSLAQTVVINPACHHDTASLWVYIDTFEHSKTACDTLKVQVLTGATTYTLATYSNLTTTKSKWVQKSFNLSAFAGHAVTLNFVGTETDTGGGTSDFLIDDTALQQAA
jgi:serine protease